MNKMLYTLAATSAACLLAPAANAAAIITITGASGIYGNDSVTCGGAPGPCSFTNTITFTTPLGYTLASVDLSSIAQLNNPATNIDFTTVTLNNVAFNIVETGRSETRKLFDQLLIAGGTNTISITGTTGGDAAYSGNLSFAAAIPEPATWGMMLLGFGLVGATMRYRRRSSIVTFA